MATAVNNNAPSATAPSSSTASTGHAVSPETAALVMSYNSVALAHTQVITVSENAAVVVQELQTIDAELSALSSSGSAVPTYVVTQAYTAEKQAQDLLAFQYQLALANPSPPDPMDYNLSALFHLGKPGQKF